MVTKSAKVSSAEPLATGQHRRKSLGVRSAPSPYPVSFFGTLAGVSYHERQRLGGFSHWEQ